MENVSADTAAAGISFFLFFFVRRVPLKAHASTIISFRLFGGKPWTRKMGEEN